MYTSTLTSYKRVKLLDLIHVGIKFSLLDTSVNVHRDHP